MDRPRPDQHIAAAKRRLAHLAGLSARTDDAEGAIGAAAQERLAAVDADLARLRPRAMIDADAGAEFQRLMLERGQLQLVIARAGQETAT